MPNVSTGSSEISRLQLIAIRADRAAVERLHQDHHERLERAHSDLAQAELDADRHDRGTAEHTAAQRRVDEARRQRDKRQEKLKALRQHHADLLGMMESTTWKET